MSNEKNVNSQKKHFGTQKKDDKIQAFIEVYKIYREVKSKNYNPKNEKSDLKKRFTTMGTTTGKPKKKFLKC